MSSTPDDFSEYSLTRKRRIEEGRRIEDIIESGAYCCLCGYYENPLIIERHHIAGRNNSDVTIPVCPNCHRILSMKQISWPKEWTSSNNSIQFKITLLLRGFDEMNRLKNNVFKQMLGTFQLGK